MDSDDRYYVFSACFVGQNQFFSAGQTGEMERDLRVAIVVIPKSLNIFAVAKNTLKEATYKIARSLTTSK